MKATKLNDCSTSQRNKENTYSVAGELVSHIYKQLWIFQALQWTRRYDAPLPDSEESAVIRVDKRVHWLAYFFTSACLSAQRVRLQIIMHAIQNNCLTSPEHFRLLFCESGDRLRKPANYTSYRTIRLHSPATLFGLDTTRHSKNNPPPEGTRSVHLLLLLAVPKQINLHSTHIIYSILSWKSNDFISFMHMQFWIRFSSHINVIIYIDKNGYLLVCARWFHDPQSNTFQPTL